MNFRESGRGKGSGFTPHGCCAQNTCSDKQFKQITYVQLTWLAKNESQTLDFITH